MTSATLPAAAPEVSLTALDQLWFQVAGTVCNLRCRHCFISCAPDNHSFWFMTREEVGRALERSVEMGVKEYYFTGGEPFMNPEMVEILADALALGPATVLTNGTLLPERTVASLAAHAGGGPYSLELRVSLDGPTAALNDAIRGEGAFERAMQGMRSLVRAGFLPIVTCMRSWAEADTPRMLDDFRALLRDIGYDRPRIKVLPPLLKGEEARRSGGYGPEARVTPDLLRGIEADRLLCTRARLVTSRGVWPCPILPDVPEARLGATLEEAVERPARLDQPACHTCWLEGALCANAPPAADR